MLRLRSEPPGANSAVVLCRSVQFYADHQRVLEPSDLPTARPSTGCVVPWHRHERAVLARGARDDRQNGCIGAACGSVGASRTLCAKGTKGEGALLQCEGDTGAKPIEPDLLQLQTSVLLLDLLRNATEIHNQLRCDTRALLQLPVANVAAADPDRGRAGCVPMATGQFTSTCRFA